MDKALALNKSNYLKGEFFAHYSSDGSKVYNQILQQHCLGTPDNSNNIEEINGVNSLLQYTLDNLQYNIEEDRLPLTEFINSEGFRNFFQPQ